MQNAWLYVLLALAVLALAQSALASVVINEVLFYPSSSGDTGLEKIELYNNGVTGVSVSGWELYPDKAGYFVFPSGFSITSHGFVTVHLKISGTANAANLYHESTNSSNMGNSSGSVALFSESGHPSASIVDFVRYHKPGSSESKTWESAASTVGLWTAGQFVDIAALAAGSSIAFSADGVRGGASSWSIATSPTIGSSNSAGITAESGAGEQSQQSEQGSSESEDSSVSDSGRPVPPSLKAYAGQDRIAVQGALVEFRGSADGINGEPLISARFSWNFGDGTTKEGKIVSHVYYFPGSYTASLNASSGEYTGADYIKITVVSPNIVISEAKTGERGFVELFNNTDYRLDLGGFLFKDEVNTFAVERDTYISPKSALVFSNAVTGLLLSGRQLSLNDAHNFMVDSADLSSPLLLEESFERSVAGGQKFIKTKSPTPGTYTPIGESGMAPKKQVITQQPSVTKRSDPADSDDNGKPVSTESEPRIADAATGRDTVPESVQKETAAVSSSSGFSPLWFLAASIIVGISAAAAFLFLRHL